MQFKSGRDVWKLKLTFFPQLTFFLFFLPDFNYTSEGSDCCRLTYLLPQTCFSSTFFSGKIGHSIKYFLIVFFCLFFFIYLFKRDLCLELLYVKLLERFVLIIWFCLSLFPPHIPSMNYPYFSSTKHLNEILEYCYDPKTDSLQLHSKVTVVTVCMRTKIEIKLRKDTFQISEV